MGPSDLSAQIMEAMGPLVSEVPRPQILPSLISPLNGGMTMPPTPTVSRCGANTILGLGAWLGEVGKRPMTLGRPGSTSSMTASAPQ